MSGREVPVKRIRTTMIYLITLAALALSATASFPWDTHLLPH
jgi:hypothetical protein